MERALNPKDEKQTIYEIYRACRLCGAGAGYKMPIIQSVVDLDCDGIELRQKIKECVQIEVNNTDRMPPLICELCVDKVNEFYEFLNMCKQNNTRTRLRLGLPLQTRTGDSVDSGNCILGVTEPIFNESDAEHRGRAKNKRKIVKKEPVNIETEVNVTSKQPIISVTHDELAKKRPKTKPKEPDVTIKSESHRPSPKPEQKPRGRETRELRETRESRELRESRESSEEARWTVISRGRRINRSPTPKRTTRQNAETTQIDTPKLQQNHNPLKTLITKNEELLAAEKSKLKRTKEKEAKVETSTPSKRPKIVPEPTKKPGPMSSKNLQKETKDIPTPKLVPKSQTKSKNIKTSPKITPKSTKPAPKPKDLVKPIPINTSVKLLQSETKLEQPFCTICKIYFKTQQGSTTHTTVKHLPTFTNPRYACNACELWFTTIEESNNHHRNHRNQNIPYKCTRCYGYFKLQEDYDEHFGADLCLSVYEVPDVKCWECWLSFPTNKLLEEHRCGGEDSRPGGKCNKCSRNYALLKNLLKHESTCSYKKKGEITIDPDVKARLLPMQVRISRCDSLLKNKQIVDTSTIPRTYGLDKKSTYPYLSHVKVKSEFTTKSFPHMVSITQDVKEEFYHSPVNWDSDASGDTDTCHKQVNSLSNISLNSIFSKKIDETSKEVNKASIDFDMEFDRTKIDSIIDNLGNDETQTTSSCDSDSILKKNNVINKKDENTTKDDQTSCDSDVRDEITKKVNNKNDEELNENKIQDTVNKTNVLENLDITEKQEITTKLDSATEKMDVTENLDVISDKIKIPEINDVSRLNTPENPANESENSKITNSIENDNDSLKVDDKTNKNNFTEEKTNISNTHLNNDTNSLKDKNTNQEINEKTENVETDLKNDKVDSDNQFSSNINDIENKEQNNVIIKNDEINKEVEESTNTTEIDENLAKIDEITNKILNENQNMTETDDKDHHDIENNDDENHKNLNHDIGNNDDEKDQKSDPNSDSISLNSLNNDLTTESMKKFDVNDLNDDDDDDRKLMEAIDAQIGENQDLNEPDQTFNNQKSNDQESNDQKSNDQESNDQEANDQESNDQEANDQESNDQEANDQESNDQEANDQESNDQESNDQESIDQKSNLINNETLKDESNQNTHEIDNDQKQECNDQKRLDQESNDHNSSDLIDNDQKLNVDQKTNESLIEHELNQELNDEKTQKNIKQHEQINKDYLIDNLHKKQDTDMRSMDLDNISDDEFNFDL